LHLSWLLVLTRVALTYIGAAWTKRQGTICPGSQVGNEYIAGLVGNEYIAGLVGNEYIADLISNPMIAWYERQSLHCLT